MVVDPESTVLTFKLRITNGITGMSITYDGVNYIDPELALIINVDSGASEYFVVYNIPTEADVVCLFSIKYTEEVVDRFIFDLRDLYLRVRETGLVKITTDAFLPIISR